MLNLHFWVKRGGASPSSARILHPHHSRLQDIATPTIQPEEPLVEVHVEVGILVVQGHHLNTTSPHDQGVVVGRVKSRSFWIGPHKLTLSTGKHIYIKMKVFEVTYKLITRRRQLSYTEPEVLEGKKTLG